jgi:signal transduction histidine kinase
MDETSLARLCQHLQRTADADRRRLARTLHDSASQTLSAAAMSLSLVEGDSPRLSVQGRRALADAQALLAACGRELQVLSQDLHPPLLGEAGLVPALRSLARRQGHRLDLTVTTLPRLEPALELTAYRLVEEALAVFDRETPVKGRVIHERAAALVISLEGRGAPPQIGGLAGLALRQRVRGAGGRLRERRGADGVFLEVRFPAPAAAAPER